ncbi:MAG: hypothetical protein JNL38_17530, partial [Myxococcales bacterium]|nr:hypothetical protein [Myxococcales bacterium]
AEMAGPAAKVRDAIVAYKKAPSPETRGAVAALLAVGPLAGDGGPLVSELATPEVTVTTEATRRMSDDALRAAITERTLLVTCKILAATTALVPGSLGDALRAAEEVSAEAARRRLALEPASAPGGDAGSDGGGDAGSTEGGAGDAGDGGGAGQARRGLLCPQPLRITDEEWERLLRGRGSRLYLDGGDTLGLRWGAIGREYDSGNAFGLWGAFRENPFREGEVDCFFGIGGRLIF